MTTTALTLASNRPQVGDAFLKFELGSHIPAVLPMRQVQEVVSLPMHRLTSMPNMPACVLGLMNRRSRVLWVIDLARVLGIGFMDASVRECNVMIARTGTTALGIAVPHVEGMAWLPPTDIQPPPGHVASGLVPYLRGCVLRSQEILLVLDAEAILHSSMLHEDS
ncbi:purine-binding chemotaxis protein CheW [Leptolyngbya sp. FACHB-36]|uniref:chemotaxis protein CheW n=1 Tax=Leptolyngbya sp. FACHB-36 TaxID=2692808 RepID=UPI0016803CFA|nr:chemotaxis protein CheW [Leptolyngbya sp. FACHB-36]MBD2022066.1 purine-binding chemotaxis protein CheW [Leptolyngbya sp. FACHB-36]